jgi:hypothetical protein
MRRHLQPSVADAAFSVIQDPTTKYVCICALCLLGKPEMGPPRHAQLSPIRATMQRVLRVVCCCMSKSERI